MNFLNVGPWEVTVILIIAILVVGPKRMVEVGRSIGRTARQMRRLSGEFLGTLQAEIDATQQEARQALEGIVETGEESVAELQAAEGDAKCKCGNPCGSHWTDDECGLCDCEEWEADDE